MISIIMNSFDLPNPFNKISRSARRIISLQSDEIIFRQDDPTHGLFYVLNGHIELVRHSAAGDAVIIHRAKQGETFAEASLFSNVYHCDARARMASQVVGFDKVAVLDAFSENSEFALELTMQFASQIQSYRRRMELFAIKDATERTFSAIADGMQTGSVMDLAPEIGLSHEAVYRALSKLVQNGRIRKIARGRYEPV